MKNKLIGYLCSIVFLSLFASCKKDDSGHYDPKIKYLPQEIKDYGYFKVGTWWVYEEETSHDLDSIYLYSSWDSIVFFDGNSIVPAGNYESIEMYAYSFYNEYNYNIWANTTWPTIYGKTALHKTKFKPGDSDGSTISFFNSIILNDSMGTSINNGWVKYVGTMDSLSISSITFFDVKKFYENRSPHEAYSPVNFYYSKNIGLIRKEVIWQNKVWNLVRYHIIQ